MDLYPGHMTCSSGSELTPPIFIFDASPKALNLVPCINTVQASRTLSDNALLAKSPQRSSLRQLLDMELRFKPTSTIRLGCNRVSFLFLFPRWISRHARPESTPVTALSFVFHQSLRPNHHINCWSRALMLSQERISEFSENGS
jgi:hypothetical protein